MSLTAYKRHFGEHTLLGPKGVLKLCRVQHPLRDAPLDEIALGQFDNVLSQCRKKTSTLGGIIGGTVANKALVLANLATQSSCPVVIVTKDFFAHCEAGDLSRLFAQLAHYSAILFFDQCDDLLDDTISNHNDNLDKQAVLKLIALRQGVTLFSLSDESVASIMKLRSPYFIQLAVA
ncbi:hypothetical protein [Aliiglaciecola litoralis]|uniref:Uncharacterized protein n=1 Tax=Aliiglaciecola litoralis TaxID=582857 RepID=A0ABP3WV99_9ALTE